MKILVTGATGLIGSQVVLALQQELGVSKADHQVLHPTRQEMDLLSKDSCQSYFKKHQPEILIHTSWYTAHGKFWSSAENQIWRESGLQMVQSFLQNGGRRVLALGTCAEYQWSSPPAAGEDLDKALNPATDLCIEGVTPLNPATFYGQQKVLFCQQLQQLIADAGADKSFLWGRVFFPYGYGEKPQRLIPLMIEAFRHHKPLSLSCGLQKRDFMFAPDLGDLIANLALSSAQGEVNVSSGEAYSLREIGKQLALVSGGDYSLLHFSSDKLTEPLWIVGSAMQRRKMVRWEPKHSLAQGLEKTYNWWLNRN